MLRAAPSSTEIAISLVVPLVVLLAAALWIRSRAWSVPAVVDRFLSSNAATWTASLLSAAATLFVWGSLSEPPVVHDEKAYLLQAGIFANVRWTGVPPPAPAFFEQPHVFVEPRLASKYPPAHSLLLSPGVRLGLPGLAPVLMSGMAGGLIFLLARAVRDPVFALIVWALWCTSEATLFWRGSYFSQNTTLLLWLAALWAFVRWRAGGAMRYLAAIAACLGLMFLARPVTAAALAAPLGFCIVAWARARGASRQLAAAALAVTPLLVVHLVWQERTAGQWLTNPYVEYSRLYLPFDMPGFGLNVTRPVRPLTPELTWITEGFSHLHEAHRLTALPGIVADRLLALLATLGSSRAFVVAGFVVGVFRARDALRFALICLLAVFAAYLSYAHPARWIVYYAEVFPVFFAIAVSGMYVMAREGLRIDTGQARAALLLTLALLTPLLLVEVARARQQKNTWSAFERTAADVLRTVPRTPAIVFVRYPADHDYHHALTGNTPDYRTAPLWIVPDRGPQNAQLLALTDRAAFTLHTDTWRLERVR
jgi:hypothetical protein